MLNWIASPFGSQEYLLMRYGVEGRGLHTRRQGQPGAHHPGQSRHHHSVAVHHPGAERAVLPDGARVSTGHAGRRKSDAAVRADRSDLDAVLADVCQQGHGADQMVYNQIGEVVLGRAPVSSIDQLISDWKSQGGDQIRAEFEQAIAAVAS